jgi:hypothetical protein
MSAPRSLDDLAAPNPATTRQLLAILFRPSQPTTIGGDTLTDAA